MDFEVVGKITHIETVAIGRSIREFRRLVKQYGEGRWRKRKGVATVRLEDGLVWLAELHWYEASSVGRKDMKIKRFLE